MEMDYDDAVGAINVRWGSSDDSRGIDTSTMDNPNQPNLSSSRRQQLDQRSFREHRELQSSSEVRST